MKALEYHNGGGNAIATTTEFPLTTTGEPGQRVVLGKFDRLRGTTATLRALDAFDLMTAGRTFKQAKRATGCSIGYLSTLLHLTPAELHLVRRGIMPLAHFHNARKTSDTSPTGDAKTKIYATIERLVKKHGFDRVYAEFDRLTAPTAVSLIAAE